MSSVTRSQIVEWMAGMQRMFLGDTPLDTSSVPRGVMQAVIKPPDGSNGIRQAAEELMLFWTSGCRVQIGGLVISVVPFDPATFIGAGYSLVAEDHDPRNDGLTEVDFNLVDFVSCLNEGETSITGEEKLKRLRASGRIRYGANVGWGLLLDYQARRENSVLETLYRLKKVAYLDFPGDTILSPDGGRSVLCLRRVEAEWYWLLAWLEFVWFATDVSTVSPANQASGQAASET